MTLDTARGHAQTSQLPRVSPDLCQLSINQSAIIPRTSPKPGLTNFPAVRHAGAGSGSRPSPAGVGEATPGVRLVPLSSSRAPFSIMKSAVGVPMAVVETKVQSPHCCGVPRPRPEISTSAQLAPHSMSKSWLDLQGQPPGVHGQVGLVIAESRGSLKTTRMPPYPRSGMFPVEAGCPRTGTRKSRASPTPHRVGAGHPATCCRRTPERRVEFVSVPPRRRSKLKESADPPPRPVADTHGGRLVGVERPQREPRAAHQPH